ncbi:MAG: hypothetical protein OXG37_12030 [Actinomycetia bacterium]|nr:hypothetical protein [Actinomycetes bacterium]
MEVKLRPGETEEQAAARAAEEVISGELGCRLGVTPELRRRGRDIEIDLRI